MCVCCDAEREEAGLAKVRDLWFSNSEVHSMSFLNDLKERAAESLLSRVFSEMRELPCNQEFEMQFFKLSEKSEIGHNLMEREAPIEDVKRVLEMESYLRSKVFERLEQEVSSVCLATVVLTDKLVLSIRASTKDCRVEAEVMDEKYKETLRRQSDKRQVVGWDYPGVGTDWPPKLTFYTEPDKPPFAIEGDLIVH